MNDDVISDLKQFIAATISQQTAHVDQRMDGLDQRMNQLETKVDDIQSSIGDALATSNDTVHAQLQDHEQRLRQLEHKPA